MAQPQAQNKLILYLLMIVGFVAGYVWYSSNSSSVVVPSPDIANDDLQKFNDIKLDFSILSNPNYTSLQQFGDIPVSPDGGGKRDLFAPF